jgi:hypothetical protein
MKNAPGGLPVTVAGHLLVKVIRDITTTPPHAYFGRAIPPATDPSKASWLIIKILYVGTEFAEVQTVDGSAGFDQIWNNRAALSYS